MPLPNSMTLALAEPGRAGSSLGRVTATGALGAGIGLALAFATALVSYVNKIAPREEHTPTLSMGVAFNHIASVAMPLLGGILWVALGYRWAFLIGLPAAAAQKAFAPNEI